MSEGGEEVATAESRAGRRTAGRRPGGPTRVEPAATDDPRSVGATTGAGNRCRRGASRCPMSRHSRHLSFDLLRLYVRRRFPTSGKCAFRGTVLINSKVGQVRQVLLCFATDREDGFEIAIDRIGSDAIVHEFDVSFSGSNFCLSRYELEAGGKLSVVPKDKR